MSKPRDGQVAIQFYLEKADKESYDELRKQLGINSFSSFVRQSMNYYANMMDTRIRNRKVK